MCESRSYDVGEEIVEKLRLVSGNLIRQITTKNYGNLHVVGNNSHQMLTPADKEHGIVEGDANIIFLRLRDG
jgi:hypothetical protein